ncbi:MAG: glutamate synthase subunit beta [Gammaproteobacteria bacterium]|nr:glutamate synthase subunit beta [Gammaproteobacteria bacterium]
MGKPTGFMEIARQEHSYAPPEDRIQHYDEFVIPLDDTNTRQQGARCMDCGIPFCHSSCPIDNIIPDWNDLVYRGEWRQALEILHSTNNFPEFTGRICPSPCEAACTLNIDDSPVTIKSIECAIVDKGWQEGWIEPQLAAHRSGKIVAIVGSGPAGLACAQQLARVGHRVELYEKNYRIGGLLRYGIPNFKLNKELINRRMAQMRTEGVNFHPNIHVGVDVPVRKLLHGKDALVLAGGSEAPRDLPVPGRDLEGVHFAMDFLTQQNRRNAGEDVSGEKPITASDKHVVVIGGGDTGSDCVGTSIRQGALSVTQLEILPQPPEREDKLTTWPNWPNRLRTSSSQEEGCQREWSVTTRKLTGEDGIVKTLHAARVEQVYDEVGDWCLSEVEDSGFELQADLVLIAMGFVHPVHEGMLKELGVETDCQGNVKANTDNYQTSVPKVFAAGDMRRGQSLVVWAIREGRQCARAVDEFLMRSSDLPR